MKRDSSAPKATPARNWRVPASKGTAGRATSLAHIALHPERAAALGEIHARPIPAIPTGRVVLHYALMNDGDPARSQATLGELARGRGLAPPQAGARFHAMPWGHGDLRWERHSEFSTFTWTGPAPKEFGEPVADHPFGAGFNTPGPLVSTARVEVRPLNTANLRLLSRFEAESLCVSLLEDGKSLLATDFRQNGDGMTVFLLLENRMTPTRIGFYVKAATDIETYRTLALVGLPYAQTLSAKTSALEGELTRLTARIRNAGETEVRSLLDEITALAGDLEAQAAASLFRFGATRAYGEIVAERLALVGNRAPPGHKDIAEFLDLRLGPALRTCRSVESRQTDLAARLTHTTELLRTRVQVGMEEQNRALLESVNRNTRLQLRLQQTVEGLSVAAIAYYLVGLFAYVVKPVEADLPFGMSAASATAWFVPVAIVLVGLIVYRIRTVHRIKP